MTPELRGQYARKPGTTVWMRAWPLSPGGSRAYSRHASDCNPQHLPPAPLLWGGGGGRLQKGPLGACWSSSVLLRPLEFRASTGPGLTPEAPGAATEVTQPDLVGLEAVRGEAGTTPPPSSFSSFLLPQSCCLLPEAKPTTHLVKSNRDLLPVHEFSSSGSETLCSTRDSVRGLDQQQRPPGNLLSS